MRLLLRIVNLAVALLLVAAAGFTWWYAVRPLAQRSGKLSLPVSGPATIVRDALGVPHIRAASIEDALLLQGFVHAQDRLFQMDGLRRLAAGELSEVVGAAALQADQESRQLRMKRVAQQHAARLNPEERKWFAAYARGVNHFIETHRGRLPVEFALLGYDPAPWSIADSILAGLQMFRSLTTSWRGDLIKRDLLAGGNPQKVDFLLPVRSGSELQPGSNAWVLSGARTSTGKPVLANDTHLDWQFPSPWYSVALAAGDLDVVGFSLAGVPSVLIGHNRRIAWGITNLHFDVQDLYAEPFDAATGRYAFQGQVEQARLEQETIRVKDAQPVTLNLWVTRHGPVVGNIGNMALALRWVAAEPNGFSFPFADLNRAGNWVEFRKALERFPGPGSNFVYADVDGNIGYQAAGRLPLRKGFRGDVPLTGSKGDREWDGFLPFEDLPSVYNPPSGLIVTANQNPFPADYKYPVDGNFASHYRSRQVRARLESQAKWKPQEMLGLQIDVYSAFSHLLAREVWKAWDRRGRNNPQLAGAAGLLEKWNGQMVAGRPEPLLATLIYQKLRRAAADSASGGKGAAYESQMAPAAIERLLRERPAGWFPDYDQTLLQAFAGAIEEGTREYGGNPEKWDYGRYLNFRLVHPVLGRLPYVGGYFQIGPTPMHGSSTTVKQTSLRMGPSMRFVADLANWESSLHNITTGQSGQPFSGHFRDQWDAYYAGRSFPMPFAKVDGGRTLEIVPLR